jgi:hypothetical protein
MIPHPRRNPLHSILSVLLLLVQGFTSPTASAPAGRGRRDIGRTFNETDDGDKVPTQLYCKFPVLWAQAHTAYASAT